MGAGSYDTSYGIREYRYLTSRSRVRQNRSSICNYYSLFMENSCYIQYTTLEQIKKIEEDSMSKRTITITEFADELEQRLKAEKTVDCCKNELLTLAKIIREKIGSEKIDVDWKD
jgi:NAD-dependent SIR2 family protein deacetylase